MADTHRDLAGVKLAQGEPEAAITEYRRSLALDPDEPDTHMGLAEAYRRKGLLTETERELREALRLDPQHQEARLALGTTFLQMQRWGTTRPPSSSGSSKTRPSSARRALL